MAESLRQGDEVRDQFLSQARCSGKQSKHVVNYLNIDGRRLIMFLVVRSVVKRVGPGEVLDLIRRTRRHSKDA